MPFKAYAAVSFNDRSPLPYDRLIYEKLEVRPRIQFHRNCSRTLKPILVPMSLTNAGLWEFSVNLKTELREHAVQSKLREVIDITITIEAPFSTNFSQIIHIGENLSQLQEFDIPNPFGAVIVKAQGSGLAIVQLDVQYNVDWPYLQIQPPFRAFDLNVSATFTGRNSSHHIQIVPEMGLLPGELNEWNGCS